MKRNLNQSFFLNISIHFSILSAFLLFLGCANSTPENADQSVALTLTQAKAVNGEYISWVEHIIDDTTISGITGSDGLSIGDLDKDGFIDVISVHETDTEYLENAKGFIRIAFGTGDPNVWESITLAEGTEVGGAEDVTVVDLNDDGYLDIVGACEWAHLIYFENPGALCRTTYWKRLIPQVTKDKGAFIRVFDADFDRDGKVEILAANKGLSDGLKEVPKDQLFPVSYFEINGNPLEDSSWKEHELIQVKVPINSQPIDFDRDGDVDIIVGSRGEGAVYYLENISTTKPAFKTHKITTSGSSLDRNKNALINAFNIDFVDLNNDMLLDIVLFEVNEADVALGTHLIWIEQPKNLTETWQVHTIGNTDPDQLVGIRLADINNDGLLDVMTGGYSRGPRKEDGEIKSGQSLGRMAWFEHPKDSSKPWIRHDISRRIRGMFDKFITIDLDRDGDLDFIATRGNSIPYDGVFWLEQKRTSEPKQTFQAARALESQEVALPDQE